MSTDTFRCLRAYEAGNATALEVAELSEQELPEGEVTIEVAWSSLNYKDALAAAGHRGVIKRLPHVPGIDAAGFVVDSKVPEFRVGQAVLVTGYDLGQGHWGGWAEKIRVPADWIVPLPTGLSLRETMIYGTAGFTAAQCVAALQSRHLMPSAGEFVVTGASGGVGSLAVRLLLNLGYRVVAVTGKPECREQLNAWGVEQVLDRADFVDDPSRPMFSSRWAGGIDTVGGAPLVRMIKETRYGGAVAACGLVAGADLNMTLYPFLLRGVALCGVASADCPYAKRLEIWQLLAGPWKPLNLDDWVTDVTLEGLPEMIEKIRAGQVIGRVIVRPGGE